MRRTFRLLFVVVAAGLLASVISCGRNSNPGQAADNRTPGQYFKEQQSSTMTPNGKILTDSVKEQDGKIAYETEDGKQWRVNYSKRADGTYRYGTPEEVK